MYKGNMIIPFPNLSGKENKLKLLNTINLQNIYIYIHLALFHKTIVIYKYSSS